ncbi:hypothetical protein, partial [Stenotrophomonas maltophilia]|uniref:hypothetical protein n=1 Tax=Stenotrophomonas maltophilia TaxID=40324 RepID=UPI001954B14D
FRVGRTKAERFMALTKISTAATDAVKRVAALSGELADNALDRTAGDELYNHEADKQDSEQGRYHQKQTP